MPGTLYVLNKHMLALIIPVSGEPDTRHWATWWKHVCLSIYWPLTSATPTLILPLHQTHHTLPRNNLMYSFPPVFCLECFFPPTQSWVIQGAWFESQTWFEFWLCHFLAMWSWAGYSSPLNLFHHVTFGQRAVENIYTALTHCPGAQGAEEAPAKGSFLRDWSALKVQSAPSPQQFFPDWQLSPTGS